jgi:hypothetical protein
MMAGRLLSTVFYGEPEQVNFVIFTVKSRAETRVTIQKIKSLGVLQNETCH